MTHVGQTDHGEDVEISKRAAESDLIVYVNINLVAMDGGHKSVAVGLAGYESLKHHHNVKTMLHSKLLHGPARGPQRDQRLRDPDGPAAPRHGVKIFQIETTLNAETFPSKPRVPEQARVGVGRLDQGLMMAARKGNELAPPRARREFFRRMEARTS